MSQLKGRECPIDGTRGRGVSSRTVRAIVGDNRPDLPVDQVWMFCGGGDCPIVYFTAAGDVIDRSAVSVRVGVKEKEAPRLVCYCFGHTVESIREEWDRTARSTVRDSITARIKAGDCRCEVSNPEGICCLGRVNRIIEGLGGEDVPRLSPALCSEPPEPSP